MSTLNARANQAFHAMVGEAGDNWLGFDHERDAFESGWENGYKVAVAEITEPTVEEVERVAHALFADTEVGEWEDGNLDTLLRYRRAARIALEAYTGREIGGVK